MARLVLPGLAIAYGAASVAVALDYDLNAPTTYAAASPALAVADLAAGLGLIAAGCFVWWNRDGAVGPLTVLLGVVWLAPDWVGWEGHSALARSVAMVAVPFLLPLLAHLVLAAPDGRVAGRAARIAVGTGYAVAAAYSLGRAALRDPFLDLYCWSNCTDNVFLVEADAGVAGALDDGWLWLTAAGGVALAALACVRLASASVPGRRALWSVLVPAALAALAVTAHAVALLSDPAEDPGAAGFQAVFVLGAASLALLAAGVAWTVVRGWRTRSALARLAADLGETPEPGTLRAALARSLGDDGLEVAYRMPGSEAYVDAEGRRVALDGRAATPIVRNGEPVAVVVHDRALDGGRELEREIGAAARLAVDNERLRAEVLAQLEDLRASRARIVEAGDAARRRIERDLHDGAQQRLLTLSYELRLAEAGGELAEASGEVGAALAELRELAHGIHPAILTEAGLGPALSTLADEAPLPVELDEAPDERLPDAVERAAYLVVSEGIEAASGDHLAVSVRREGGELMVSAGPVRSAPSLHLADRVGALGGRIGTEGGMLRAVIPCG